MGRGQGGEKYDWGIDWEGYDVCEKDETLLKIDVDITSDEYKESIGRKKERAAFLRQVYEQKVYSQHRLLHPIPVPPIIARAAGIPGTQEIVPIHPLWSVKLDLGLQRYIEEVPGDDLNIDQEKRELMLADGSLVPNIKIIIAAGLQDQTLKRLSQPIAKNDFHVDIVDGAITINDEADAIRLQRFIHKPTQPGGKKWL
ncbi:MAG: hypothetical protein EZS28_017757 [Streblomastix strix]|uniref:Uncharacterized protein n=1 Tax=Streblomastix strix TaxID=222440 RepID=A0A5J4VVS7_9EUKA|nr:MAG: hypothetical protein EZS28_017757 [Streblomastix strix]